MSSNPPGGGKGMGKSPGGGLTKVFSSFLQDVNISLNSATLRQAERAERRK
jgi:hypothetical protein